MREESPLPPSSAPSLWTVPEASICSFREELESMAEDVEEGSENGALGLVNAMVSLLCF